MKVNGAVSSSERWRSFSACFADLAGDLGPAGDRGRDDASVVVVYFSVSSLGDLDLRVEVALHRPEDERLACRRGSSAAPRLPTSSTRTPRRSPGSRAELLGEREPGRADVGGRRRCRRAR